MPGMEGINLILTKAKETELGLIPGVKDITFNFIDALSCGNYWVDWAENFVSVCQDILGLEIEKGPGTSIGPIWTASSANHLCQFDEDWTQENGRIPDHDYCEVGKSLWEGVEVWDNNTNSSSNGLNDDTDTSLLNIGIDKKNKRFDFIIWFTTNETDVNNNPKERLGIRMKYPLTTPRMFGDAYAISNTPIIMLWKKNNTDFNNNFKNLYWTRVPSGVDVPLDSNIANFYNNFNNRFLNFSNVNTNMHNVTYYKTDCSATKTFLNEKNYNWPHYSEFSQEEENDYNALGGKFVSSQGNKAVSYYRQTNNSFNKVKIIISKNKKTVNLMVTNNSNTIAFNILYGDLIEKQINNENIINSFLMITTNNFNDNECHSFITEENEISYPPKQVNRPSIINVDLPSYCGISRVLLHQQTLHCAELYQVFSFNSLMNDQYNYNQVFIDNNQLEHQFILFNYGDGTRTDSSNGYENSVAYAVPI